MANLHINGSTEIDNSNMSLNDILKNISDIKAKLDGIKAYIIDGGLTSQWTWYKFNNGLILASYAGNLTLNINNPEGSMYYSEKFTIPFPSGLFNKAPAISVTVEVGGGYNGTYAANGVSKDEMTGWVYFNLSKTNVSMYLNIIAMSRK